VGRGWHGFNPRRVVFSLHLVIEIMEIVEEEVILARQLPTQTKA